MSYGLLRNKLDDLKGLSVVVTLKSKDGGTDSVLSSVGVDYIGLRCEAKANELLIPMEAIATIIRKS